MRKATVISIVPFEIHKNKPGLFPGIFDIPACVDFNKPSILYVEESMFFVEVDVDRSIQVKVPPGDVAKSLVYDYATSCLEYNDHNNAGPGIFYIDDEYTQGRVIRDLKDELKNAQERQHNWFLSLVKLADDDWQKSGGIQRTISDTQRYAARHLNLERPWLIDTKELGIDTIKCVACRSMIASDAIICPNCKLIINMESWKSLKFAETR